MVETKPNPALFSSYAILIQLIQHWDPCIRLLLIKADFKYTQMVIKAKMFFRNRKFSLSLSSACFTRLKYLVLCSQYWLFWEKEWDQWNWHFSLHKALYCLNLLGIFSVMTRRTQVPKIFLFSMKNQKCVNKMSFCYRNILCICLICIYNKVLCEKMLQLYLRKCS